MHHSSFRTVTPYSNPLERRSGYTESRLTTGEHLSVIGAVSLFCTAAARPITKLDQFYFLSDIPGESNRIYLADKRAHLFKTLFETRWFSGTRFIPTVLDNAFLLAVYASLHASLPGGEVGKGFLAGGLTGLTMSVVHHPFDVLRATADARQGPRLFTGPWDVLKTALKERPAVLLGLYKGFAMNGMSTSLRYSTQFGVYNALRYDGVYRHPLVLFAYCHMGAFLGMLIQYPFLAIKQQLRIVNSLNGGKYPHNYRSYISQVKRQHGVTKLFEGFFTGKPVLNAVPPALLMTLYDIGVRRYTEYLHPELRTVATPEQSLMHIKSPSYPVTDSSYEFTPRR